MDKLEQEAAARHEMHKNHPTHRPLSEGYWHVALVGEDALAKAFGLTVDMVRRPNGDGGVDNYLPLRLSPDEKVTMVPVDVKTARKPFNLLVEVGKVKPKTIYMLASFDDATKTSELLGWQWGLVLLGAPTSNFGYGVTSHYIPREDLRPLSDIRERMA
jgi:hypothetical protein